MKRQSTNNFSDFPSLDPIEELESSSAQICERNFDVIVVSKIHFNFILGIGESGSWLAVLLEPGKGQFYHYFRSNADLIHEVFTMVPRGLR